jgi:uncharacterized protein YeaO (DUF488 family)
MSVRVKRASEKPDQGDGRRVLVDRLWPRGTKERAGVHEWSREIAPSDVLRQWVRRNLEEWEEFKRRYYRELDQRAEEVDELVDQARRGRVTLLHSSRDDCHNAAAALAEYQQKEYYV